MTAARDDGLQGMTAARDDGCKGMTAGGNVWDETYSMTPVMKVCWAWAETREYRANWRGLWARSSKSRLARRESSGSTASTRRIQGVRSRWPSSVTEESEIWSSPAGRRWAMRVTRTGGPTVVTSAAE